MKRMMVVIPIWRQILSIGFTALEYEFVKHILNLSSKINLIMKIGFSNSHEQRSVNANIVFDCKSFMIKVKGKPRYIQTQVIVVITNYSAEYNG